MSQAYNTFMHSYFKRLKRPELFNYNADQSFGANMVHGSEEQNPWANRNQDNAKYGNLGGNNNKVVQGPEFTANPLAPGGFTQIANGPSASGQSGLNSIMSAITAPVGQYLGNSISDWLNPNPAIGDIANKLALETGKEVAIPNVAENLAAIGDKPLAAFEPTMGAAGDAFTGIGNEMTKGSTEALKNTIAGGTSTLPTGTVGGGLSLLVDSLTGQLRKDPISSVSKAGGTVGGAVLGSMLMPGVGTILGSMLGGTGGGFLGKFIKKIFD